MGVIIINVPLKIKKEFVINKPILAQKILKILENEGITKNKIQQEEELYEIVGIWKDRFEDTSKNIQREWRKFLVEKVLIDTCIFIDIFRGNRELLEEIINLPNSFVNSIVYMKLVQRARNKAELEKILRFLKRR